MSLQHGHKATNNSHPTPASGTSNSTGASVGGMGSIGSSPGIGIGSAGNISGSVPTFGTAAQQHRFIVSVEGTPAEFTEQMVACAINFVAKELALLVEQSVTSPTREHVVIQDWIDHPKRVVRLEVLDATGSVVDTIMFRDTIVIDHMVDFNYGNLASVVHVLGLQYDKIDLGAGKAQAAYNSAMSVVGKP